MRKLVCSCLRCWDDVFTPQLGTVGITEYAANLLGDVVYVELPAVDSYVSQGGTIAPLVRDLLGRGTRGRGKCQVGE
jgi:hypothetical protein